MKTYDYAHQASKLIAQERGEMDQFNCWEYTDNLLEQGLIVMKPRKHSSGHEYYPVHGDLWYIFSEIGEQEHGPFETKSEALGFAGEDSAAYVDTGIYNLSDDRYVARREIAIEYEFEVEPPPE